MFINYAHRGASAYAPENTMASFRMGWEMGANGVETDVQRTRDGVLVLFHDNDLMRIIGRPEAIHDLTYGELLQLDFGKGEKLPTLEEFLQYFQGKSVHMAIEIKEEGIEKEMLDLLERYVPRENLVVTSGIFGALKTVRALRPEIRTGYLAKRLTPQLVGLAREAGIWQICPKASILTEEWCAALRAAGFSVRAWGIENEELMRRMLALRVDGMTINFPDKAIEAGCMLL